MTYGQRSYTRIVKSWSAKTNSFQSIIFIKLCCYWIFVVFVLMLSINNNILEWMSLHECRNLLMQHAEHSISSSHVCRWINTVDYIWVRNAMTCPRSIRYYWIKHSIVAAQTLASHCTIIKSSWSGPHKHIYFILYTPICVNSMTNR